MRQQAPMFYRDMEDCDKLPDQEHYLLRYDRTGRLVQQVLLRLWELFAHVLSVKLRIFMNPYGRMYAWQIHAAWEATQDLHARLWRWRDFLVVLVSSVLEIVGFRFFTDSIVSYADSLWKFHCGHNCSRFPVLWLCTLKSIVISS